MKKAGLIVGLLRKERSRLQSQFEIINDTCTTSFREKIILLLSLTSQSQSFGSVQACSLIKGPFHMSLSTGLVRLEGFSQANSRTSGLPSLKEICLMAAMFKHVVKGCVPFSQRPCKAFPVRLPISRLEKPRFRLAGQSVFSYEHIEILTKEAVAKWGPGNRG